MSEQKYSRVEVYCALTADVIARQSGQEEPGASRVLVELGAELP